MGKYRVGRRLGSGGFAQVFRAVDTVEGVSVALKVPFPALQTPEALEDFRREIRVAARLDHPNVLAVKNADFVDGTLVVAYSLGERTLADRLRRRIRTATCLDLGLQLLEALAHAHSRRVIHCDVKPENLILFPGDRLCLTDFGISKVCHRTMSASGSGTIGYVAPEQAMGKPSFRSDVFAAGLVLYRMLSGCLPAWPFEWPLPGLQTLRRKLSPQGVAFLRRALEVEQRRRFRDAQQMLAAYRRLLPSVRSHGNGRNSRRRETGPTNPKWPERRWREFAAVQRGAFRLNSDCARCGGPVSEEMRACPWCGTDRPRHRGRTALTATCPRCGRGRKREWRFCAWCHGPGFREVATRRYPDRRYSARCPDCGGGCLPFSRYCPWCRRKLRRSWRIPQTRETCPHCRWSVFGSFWEYCPWCRRPLRPRT